MSNIFKTQLNELPPKTKEECYRIDPVSHNLWEWAKRLENFGIILMIAILIIGIFTCGKSSYVLETNSYGYKIDETFSFKIFISLYVNQILYAVLCYLAHHSVALIIGGLASIVQNTRISARISQYNLLVADEENGAGKEDIKTSNKEGPKESKKLNMWYCPECERKNYYSTCQCGYKPDEFFAIWIDDEKHNKVCDCCKQMRDDVKSVTFRNSKNKTVAFLCESCIKKIYQE